MLISFALGVGLYGAIYAQDAFVFIIPLFSILFGITAWTITKLISEKFARIFFYLQKISGFHFMIKPELSNDKDYFLTLAPKSSASSLFLLWIGSWALVVFIAYNLVFTLGVTLPTDEAKISGSFDVLILAWILTPIVALIVVPIRHNRILQSKTISKNQEKNYLTYLTGLLFSR